MAYPGNQELSSQAQERVVTAFRQVVSKLQDGQREEALIGLEFVLRLDPAFRPAVNLHKQLSSGASEIDLSEIISQLQAPTTEALNVLLVEAVEEFNQRKFVDAQSKVEQVLLELPGHQEARQLLTQIRDALKVETQVAQFLSQAREALDQGDPQEAANFVMMAQALDPHHPGIEGTLQEIYAAGGAQVQPFAAAEREPADHGEVAPSFDSVADGDDAFTVQFDELDDAPAPPAAGPTDSPPSAGAAPESGESAPSLWDEGGDAPESFAGDDDLFGPTGDVADLFEAEPEPPADDFAPAALDEPDDEDGRRIADLLDQGENAFAGDDFLGAIDIWSRIFLVDPEHAHAEDRIAEAARRADEIARRVGHMLFDARDAMVGGDPDTAKRLLDDVRGIAPHSLEAEDLRQQLAGRAEAPAPSLEAPPAPEMPDLDDDLFREEIPVTEELDELSLDLPGAAPDAGRSVPPPRPVLRRRTIPWRIVAAAGAGVGIILIGVWLGSLLLGSGPEEDTTEALNRILAEAETLYSQHRVEEAVHLLQQFEPSSDLDQTRVDRRLSKYQADLAPPTPTPVPADLGAAETLLEEGRWYAAFELVATALEKQPNDPALSSLREQVLAIEPDATAAYHAIRTSNHRAAVGILEELVEDHPGQEALGDALESSLYNAALAELRVYNLTGADGFLRRLDERSPGDPDVARIQEFIDQYKTRPADMRLKIFIKNLEWR